MTPYLDCLNDAPAFDARLAESPVFARRVPEEPIPSDGPCLILGVVPWSTYDLILLDELEAEAIRARPQARTIAVFNMDRLRGQSDLDRYIPGIGRVVQPPAVGMWEDGVATAHASGYAARRLVGQSVGIDASLEDRIETYSADRNRRINELVARPLGGSPPRPPAPASWAFWLALGALIGLSANIRAAATTVQTAIQVGTVIAVLLLEFYRHLALRRIRDAENAATGPTHRTAAKGMSPR